MRDAAGDLAERAQPLLLHHGLLGLAQILVGALQRFVEPRLVRGQRHVAGELPQEFAVVAAERVDAPLGDEHDAEHFALDHQRRRHQRAQAAAREPRR